MAFQCCVGACHLLGIKFTAAQIYFCHCNTARTSVAASSPLIMCCISSETGYQITMQMIWYNLSFWWDIIPLTGLKPVHACYHGRKTVDKKFQVNSQCLLFFNSLSSERTAFIVFQPCLLLYNSKKYPVLVHPVIFLQVFSFFKSINTFLTFTGLETGQEHFSSFPLFNTPTAHPVENVCPINRPFRFFMLTTAGTFSTDISLRALRWLTVGTRDIETDR